MTSGRKSMSLFNPDVVAAAYVYDFSGRRIGRRVCLRKAGLEKER